MQQKSVPLLMRTAAAATGRYSTPRLHKNGRPFTLQQCGLSTMGNQKQIEYSYSKPGSPPSILSASELKTSGPTTAPSAGNIVVKWEAAGIDPVDLAILSGDSTAASFAPGMLPAVPGSEGVGVVTAVAGDITSVQKGDRVIPVKTDVGTWREYGQVAASDVMRIPDGLRTELAATLPGSSATAYRLLHDFEKLRPGDVIVQTGAGGPVGSAVAQLASSKGIQVISLVSENGRDYSATVERLKLHGCAVAVGESYVENSGVRAVLQDVGEPKLALHGGSTKQSFGQLGKVVGNGCRVVSYCPGVVDEDVVKKMGLKHEVFSLADWLRGAERGDVEQMIQEVGGRMMDGSLTGWLQRVEFRSLPHAIRRGGVTRRKLVAMME